MVSSEVKSCLMPAYAAYITALRVAEWFSPRKCPCSCVMTDKGSTGERRSTLRPSKAHEKPTLLNWMSALVMLPLLFAAIVVTPMETSDGPSSAGHSLESQM